MENYNKWISILANLGVLAGLILVAFELDQTNDLMAAQDRYNRLSALTASQNLYLQNVDTVAITNKVAAGDELTPGEQLALDIVRRNSMRLREWTYRELPIGELPIEQWKRGLDSIGVRDFWAQEKDEYDAEFVVFIDSQIIDN